MGRTKTKKKGSKKTPKQKPAEVIVKPKVESKLKPEETNDTIFIRNLSFDTEEDQLKEFFEANFGETSYCLICRDKETDESKGTGFVKFKDPEGAKKCLKEFKDKESQTKFHLAGRNLMLFPAINRERIHEVEKKDDKTKDKRNLALAREGFIRPNSEEAEEVSKSDMEKRRVLDARKRDLLKNLHNFVSDTRLCIHNLPPSVDDHKLRSIFLDNVKPNYPESKIVECRVMRNKKGNTGQLGTSKGFGFVAFSKHEHARAALKALNNNPKVFSNDKRPIVEFSIENMVALNKKKTRLVNSQRKLDALRNKKEQQTATKKPEKKVKKNTSKKTVAKKMKRKSTVTVKSIDSSEEANILKKINKIKGNKNKLKAVSA